MRFSADTDLDSLESQPLTNNEIIRPPHAIHVSLHPLRQPNHLVSDVLLEIMGWLAFMDWLVLSNPLRYPRSKRTQRNDNVEPGYSLIRATHVCRYWRIVALENRSLWSYIPLSGTISRKFSNIYLEFVTRVHRSLGLVRGIHVSYTDSPLYEEFSGARAASFTNEFRQSGYSEPSMCYCDLVYDYGPLHPLIAHTIKRCASLSLKGSAETLSEIFGHLTTKDQYAPYFEEDILLLRHVIHPAMPLSPPPESISVLPLLTEFTLEVEDSASQYYLPFLPSLRKLTLIRKETSPPLKLPISPWISTGPPQAIFPVLAEFLIFANNLDIPSLHDFIIAHANTLTSLTIDSTIDVFNPQTLPAHLHQASFAIPLRETEQLVQVPPYIDTRPSDSPGAFVVNLHKLVKLSIRHLTPLLSPHVHTWACRVLEELELTFPSRPPPPTSFLTESYASLRKLVYRFPQHAFTRENWNLPPLVDPDPHDVKGQAAHSNLLTSLLRKLPTLEELVIDGWIFRHIWREVDWTESLMPPGAASLQDYGVEYDLDLIEDDPWNPNRNPRRPSHADRRRERWETQDGMPFSVRNAKISDAGMLLDDNGQLLAYAGSEYSSDDGEHPANADEDAYYEITHTPINESPTRSLSLDVTSTNPTEFACPRLSQLELRQCFGVERSSMFIVLRERARLAEESFLMGKVEESWSPAACSGSSRAASSDATTSPISSRPGGISPGAGTDDTSQWPSSLSIDSCAQVTVMTYECALTDEEFEDLYAQFIRGEYVVRKPRKPQTHPESTW